MINFLFTLTSSGPKWENTTLLLSCIFSQYSPRARLIRSKYTMPYPNLPKRKQQGSFRAHLPTRKDILQSSAILLVCCEWWSWESTIEITHLIFIHPTCMLLKLSTMLTTVILLILILVLILILPFWQLFFDFQARSNTIVMCFQSASRQMMWRSLTEKSAI